MLLGHTLDDQAETVLLGLTRGSGGRSLAGMRRAFGVFRRPLLDLTRAQTEPACRAEGIDWWTDPANDDPRFTRSRVRHDVLPLLETELGPGVAATLARTADLLRADVEPLDELAAAAYGGLSTTLPVDGRSRSRRRSARGCCAWRRWRRAARDADLFHEHVRALDALLTDWHGQGAVDLPGRRADGRVTSLVLGTAGRLEARPPGSDLA